MILKQVKTQKTAKTIKLIGVFESKKRNKQEELFFKYPIKFEKYINESADPFVPALLIPSMKFKEDLEIVPPISKKLKTNLSTIIDIYSQWYPKDLKKIKVKANNIKEINENKKENAAAFFSMGADSMHTLCKDLIKGYAPSIPANHNQLTHLIYMQGFEQPLSIYEGQEDAVIDDIEAVAKESGKEAIVGQTNIRDIFPLPWGPYYHGAGLSSAALSLSKRLKYVRISSSHTFEQITSWGSSPLVDNLWSNEEVFVLHAGSETPRAEKVAFISSHPLGQKYLRLCTKNKGGTGNCGECWKCMRTMIAMHIAGNLDKAKTLPNKLPAKLKIDVNPANDSSFLKQNLELAKKYDVAPKFIKQLKNMLTIAEKTEKMRLLTDDISFFPLQFMIFKLYFIEKNWNRIVKFLRKLRMNNPKISKKINDIKYSMQKDSKLKKRE